MKRILTLCLLLFVAAVLNSPPPASSVCGNVYTANAPISISGQTGGTITGKVIDLSGASTSGISLTNCHNMTIRKVKIQNGTGDGITLENCSGIRIDSSEFFSLKRGINAMDNTTGGIDVEYNQFHNMLGPKPAGQFMQFNNITGAGNKFSNNLCWNEAGTNPEDAVSCFESGGTSGSPLDIGFNIIVGGGPSHSGGGIMLGDFGGTYEIAHDNILVNPGQYGISISGGDHNSIVNNKVYAQQNPWTNVGIYVWNNAIPGLTITNATVSGNHVKWTNSAGDDNGSWLAPGESNPTGWSTNNFSDNTLDATIAPTPLFPACTGPVLLAPVIAYSPTSNTYTAGSAISNWTPTNTGGAATGWSINSALPAGLSFNTSTGRISGTPSAAAASRTYTVTATNAAGSGTFGITITVNAAPINIPIINYANNDPTYTYKTAIAANSPTNTGAAATSWSVTPALPAGLAFNSSTGVITGTPTQAQPTVAYTVTATNASGSDNAIVNIVVSKVALVVTASSGSRAYGASNPSFSVSYSGFVGGDNASSLSVQPVASTSASAGSNVGSYAVVPSVGVSTNYAFSYVNGTLTVTSVGLTITVNNFSRQYGATGPTFTATYSGFVNGNTPASLNTLPTFSTTAVSNSSPGTYPITANGASSSNYVISYFPGTLTISKSPLQVIATSVSKVQGASNPTLAYTFTGFRNGETSGVLLTQPAISTTAVQGSAIGTYPITVSGGSSNNYTFGYTAGVLTVTTAPSSGTHHDKWHRRFVPVHHH